MYFASHKNTFVKWFFFVVFDKWFSNLNKESKVGKIYSKMDSKMVLLISLKRSDTLDNQDTQNNDTKHNDLFVALAKTFFTVMSNVVMLKVVAPYRHFFLQTFSLNFFREHRTLASRSCLRRLKSWCPRAGVDL